MPTLMIALVMLMTAGFGVLDDTVTRDSRLPAVKPLVTLTGAHSGVTQRSYLRVTSMPQWAALWLRHRGEDPALARHPSFLHYNKYDVPEVDFEQCMVIAIFQGPGYNSAGLSAVLEEDDDRLLLRFDEKSFQTSGEAEPVRAYGFFVLPRSSKLIVVEENVQHLLNGPPVWQERVRFERLD